MGLSTFTTGFALMAFGALSACGGAGESIPKSRVRPVLQNQITAPFSGSDLGGLWLERCEEIRNETGTLLRVRRRSLRAEGDGTFSLYETQYRSAGCLQPLYSRLEGGTYQIVGSHLMGSATAVDMGLEWGGYVLHSGSGLGLLREICPRVSDTLAPGTYVSTDECDGRRPRTFLFHTAFRTEAVDGSLLRSLRLIGGLDFVANTPATRGDTLPEAHLGLLQVSQSGAADPVDDTTWFQ